MLILLWILLSVLGEGPCNTNDMQFDLPAPIYYVNMGKIFQGRAQGSRDSRLFPSFGP